MIEVKKSLALLLLIALLVLPACSTKPDQPDPVNATPTENQAIRVLAPDIKAAYMSNEVGADLEYKGKHLEYLGLVDSVSSDHGISIRMKDSDDFSVYAYFPDNSEDIEKIAKLQSGDLIIVIGRFDGAENIDTGTIFDYGYMSLRDCALSEVYSAEFLSSATELLNRYRSAPYLGSLDGAVAATIISNPLLADNPEFEALEQALSVQPVYQQAYAEIKNLYDEANNEEEKQFTEVVAAYWSLLYDQAYAKTTFGDSAWEVLGRAGPQSFLFEATFKMAAGESLKNFKAVEAVEKFLLMEQKYASLAEYNSNRALYIKFCSFTVCPVAVEE